MILECSLSVMALEAATTGVEVAPVLGGYIGEIPSGLGSAACLSSFLTRFFGGGALGSLGFRWRFGLLSDSVFASSGAAFLRFGFGLEAASSAAFNGGCVETWVVELGPGWSGWV